MNASASVSNARSAADPVTGSRATTWLPWFGGLLAIGLLLCRLPYRGVRHDSVLYLAQAISHLDPDWARADLFFVGGFQDRYSVFSNVLALALKHFEMGATCIVFLLGAWSLYLWALHKLAPELPSRDRWLAVVAVVCVSHYYGAARVFGYFEDFLTARTWAEPLALLALAGFLRGRRRRAAGTLLIAALVHPLIALPVGLVFFLLLAREDRRWLWLLTGVVPLAALALAGVPPFNGLLFEYDPGWLDMTKQANSAVFIGQWERADVVAALVSLGVAWAAHAGSVTPLARACRAAAIGAVALCVLSFVGADVMHDLLLTQLQLWRALWIVNLLAMFSLPGWLFRLWEQGASGRLAACAVLVAVVTADSWIPTSWALALWAAMALLLHHRAVKLKPSITRLAMIATLVAGVMLCLLQAWNAHGQMAMHLQGMAIARSFSIPFTLPLLTLPLAVVMFAAWNRGGARRAVAVAVSLAILALGISQWDQRTAWTRFVESSTRGAHPFDALIPAGSQVYWHGDLAATWFLLGRPEFIGQGQLSGLLFSRELAVVASRRTPLLREVMATDHACSTLEWFGAKASELPECRLPSKPFFAMCSARPDHADFLVSSTDFGTGVVARWTFAPPDESPVTYALYDCRRVVASLPPPAERN